MYWLALVIGLLAGGFDQGVFSPSAVSAPSTTTISAPAVKQGARMHKSEGTVPIPPN